MSVSPQEVIYVGGHQSTPTATYGMAEKLSAGEVPHNEQMVRSLEELETPLKIQSELKPGQEGRFAYGAAQLVQHTRELLQAKNSDDFLVQVERHIKQAGELLARQVPQAAVAAATVGAGADNWARVQVNQLQRLFDAFKRLCLALARKSQFRVKLIEGLVLLQETAAHLTAEVGEKVEKAVEKMEGPGGMSQSSQEILKGIVSAGVVEGKKEESPEEEKKRKEAEEKARETRKKGREILQELAKTEEYQQLVEELMGFFQTNWAYLSAVLSSAKDDTEVDQQTVTSLVLLASDLQAFFEKFSGDESLTPLTSTIAKLLIALPNDSDFQDFLKHFTHLLKSTLPKAQAQISSGEAKAEVDTTQQEKEWEEMWDKAKKLSHKKSIREDVYKIVKETQGMIDRIGSDKNLQTLAEDIERLGREILGDGDGMRVDTLRKAVGPLKNVLLPALVSALATIPIPPVSIINEKYDVYLSNLSLSAQDLLPERIRIHFMNDILFDFNDDNGDKFVSSLYVGLRDFRGFVRDLNFKYDRKKMPQISDVGIADVEIVGLNIEIRWRMDFIGSRLLFYIDAVRCFIRQVNTTVKESRHMVINKIAASFFNSSLKSKIELTVEDILRQKLLQFTIDTAAPLSEQIPIPL